MTIEQATHDWVSEFNAVPTAVIRKLASLREGEVVEVTASDNQDAFLPVWRTMWSFSDECDNHWLKYSDGIKIMERLGFKVYEQEDFGYIFGIDGFGYDFYKRHWIPLYRERGLQWHTC